jgi:hypothetical protein
MKPRDIFLASMRREANTAPRVGSATSVVTTDLMDKVGVWFPEAHLNPEKMAMLAAAGYTELGFDNVMPLFSVCHESSALGCKVDWGDASRMPKVKPCCPNLDDGFAVPNDSLLHPSCTVHLQAIRTLNKQYGNEVGIVSKVFGFVRKVCSWNGELPVVQLSGISQVRGPAAGLASSGSVAGRHNQSIMAVSAACGGCGSAQRERTSQP